MNAKNYQLLPSCGKEAEGLDIILACDGASSVGQVGHEVAVFLTKKREQARMCCITAVGANSKVHIGIAQKARKLIVINGCALKCAGKIVRDKGIEPDYEMTISEEGVDKIPTLDFDDEAVEKIALKIANEVLSQK